MRFYPQNRHFCFTVGFMGLSGFAVLFRFDSAIRQRAEKEGWDVSDRTHPTGWSDTSHPSFSAVVKNTDLKGNMLAGFWKLLIF
jgi:hypothetical protein